MPQGLPCPNPVCTHVFPPDAIRGATVLKCPRCGHSFQFGPSSSAPSRAPEARPSGRGSPARPTPAKPPTAPPPAVVAKEPRVSKVPPPPKPPARPPRAEKPTPPPPAVQGSPPVAVAEVVPLAVAVAPVAPVAPTTPANDPNLLPPEDFVAARLRRGKGGPRWVRWIPLMGFGMLVALLGGLAIGFRAQISEIIFKAASNDGRQGNEFESPLAYAFTYPISHWTLDDATKFKFNCKIGMKRTDPNSWLAILVKDYKKQTPNEADLVEEGVRRLRDSFVKNESTDQFEYEVDTSGNFKLADRPAARMVFKVEANSLVLVGQVYMIGQNGMGYWFVTYGPGEVNGKSLEEWNLEEWDSVRKNFRLTSARDHFSAEPAFKPQVVNGVKFKYAVTLNSIIWTPQDKPTETDPRADSAFIGEDIHELESKEKSAFGGAKRATGAVLILPKTEDLPAAVVQAKEYLLEQQKNASYKETVIEDADDNSKIPTGQDVRIGSELGHLLRLKVRNKQDRVRLIYLAVIHKQEQDVVIELESAWQYRAYWDVHFQQVLNKFYVRKGG